MTKHKREVKSSGRYAELNYEQRKHFELKRQEAIQRSACFNEEAAWTAEMVLPYIPSSRRKLALLIEPGPHHLAVVGVLRSVISVMSSALTFTARWLMEVLLFFRFRVWLSNVVMHWGIQRVTKKLNDSGTKYRVILYKWGSKIAERDFGE